MQSSDKCVFFCPEHPEQIFSMKEVLNCNIQFYCVECFMESHIKIDKLKQQLNQLAQDKIQILKNKEQKSVKEYESLKLPFIKIQKEINESINKIIDKINTQIELLKDDVQKEVNQLKQVTEKTRMSEIKDTLQKLKQHEFQIGQQNIDQFKLSILNLVSNLYRAQISNLKQLIPQNIREYILKFSKQVQINSRAMTMIQNDSILITSNYSDIQIWGLKLLTLELYQTLSVHKRVIRNLLAFKDDSFISASLDCIIIWKELKSNQWEIMQKLLIGITYPSEELAIVCTENVLVYTSGDLSYYLSLNSQKIFEYNRNDWLRFGHFEFNIFLSNCPSDQEIKKKLIYVNSRSTFFGNQHLDLELDKNDKFLRVSYTDENEIVGTTKNGYFYSYKVANDEIELLKQKLQLNTDKEMNPFQFPIIYHPKLKMVVCRHSEIVYILKKDENDQYSIIQELHGIYRTCTISKDGNFIILGTAYPFKFEVWEIF